MIDIGKFLSEQSTSLLKKDSFYIKQYFFPGKNVPDIVIPKFVTESETFRTMMEMNRFSTKDESINTYENNVDLVKNVIQQVVLLDCSLGNVTKASKACHIVSKETAGTRITGYCTPIKRNMFEKEYVPNNTKELNFTIFGKKVENAKEEFITQDGGLQKDVKLYLIQYNTSGAGESKNYMCYQVDVLSDGTIDYKWLNELYKKTSFESKFKGDDTDLAKYVTRLNLATTPSKRTFKIGCFMVLKSFVSTKDEIVGKGVPYDGHMWFTPYGQMKMVTLCGLEVGNKCYYDTKDEKIKINGEEVKANICAQVRMLGTSKAGASCICYDIIDELIENRKNIIKVQRSNPISKILIEAFKKKTPFPEGYEDIEGVIFYEKDAEEKVEFVMDCEVMKESFNPNIPGYLNVLKITHNTHTAHLNVQIARSLLAIAPIETLPVLEGLALRQAEEASDELANTEVKPLSKEVSFTSEILKRTAPLLFMHDKNYYETAIKQAISTLQNDLSRLHFKVNGMNLTLIPCLDKMFGLKILRYDEAYSPDVKGGVKAIRHRVPFNGYNEVIAFKFINKKQLFNRIEVSNTTARQKKILKAQIELMAESTILLHPDVVMMSIQGGEDWDIDSNITYLSHSNPISKKIIINNRKIEVGSILDNQLIELLSKYTYKEVIKKTKDYENTTEERLKESERESFDAKDVLEVTHKTILKDTSYDVGKCTNNNMIVLQALREASLAQYFKENNPDAKYFDGVGPTAQALIASGNFFNGNAKYKGLQKLKINDFDVVEISQDKIQHIFTEVKKSKKKFENVISFLKNCNALASYYQGDIIDTRKTFEELYVQPEYKNICNFEIASMKGFTFEWIEDTKRDMVRIVGNVERINKKIEEDNKENEYKKPLIIKDELYDKLLNIGTLMASSINTIIPKNKYYNNIVKKYYNSETVPRDLVAYCVALYLNVTYSYMDNDKMMSELGKTKEEKEILKTVANKRYKSHKDAIRVTLLSFLKGFTTEEIGIIIKAASSMGCRKGNLGQDTKENKFSRVYEDAVSLAMLKIAQKETNREIKYEEKLVRISNHPYNGEKLVFKNGIDETFTFISNIQDGVYTPERKLEEFINNKGEKELKETWWIAEDVELVEHEWCNSYAALQANVTKQTLPALNDCINTEVYLVLQETSDKVKTIIVDKEGKLIHTVISPLCETEDSLNRYNCFINEYRSLKVVSNILATDLKYASVLIIEKGKEITDEEYDTICQKSGAYPVEEEPEDNEFELPEDADEELDEYDDDEEDDF